MRQFAIERSLHILGPVLGRKRGVEVCIGGGAACTDGKTIWLPSLPLDDAEAAALGFGLLFHETNHVRYTDFEVARGEGLVGALTNALEDIRIDGLGHREYPGGRREEEQLVAALIRRGEAKQYAKDDHPARILESYVMWRLEYDVLGIDAAQGMAETAETLPGDLQDRTTKLDALMFGVRDCRSTSEAHELARRIGAMLEQEAHEEEMPQPKEKEQEAQPEQQGDAASVLRQTLDASLQDHVSGIGELAQAAITASGEAPELNLPMLRGKTSAVAPTSGEGVARLDGGEGGNQCAFGSGSPGCYRRRRFADAIPRLSADESTRDVFVASRPGMRGYWCVRPSGCRPTRRSRFLSTDPARWALPDPEERRGASDRGGASRVLRHITRAAAGARCGGCSGGLPRRRRPRRDRDGPVRTAH